MWISLEALNGESNNMSSDNSTGADYAALAERVIENAEKTVLGEAQLQSNLECGILEAEQQYLATLGEEKLRAMEMLEYELLDALGLSEPEVRGTLCYGIFTAS